MVLALSLVSIARLSKPFPYSKVLIILILPSKKY